MEQKRRDVTEPGTNRGTLGLLNSISAGGALPSAGPALADGSAALVGCRLRHGLECLLSLE